MGFFSKMALASGGLVGTTHSSRLNASRCFREKLTGCAPGNPIEFLFNNRATSSRRFLTSGNSVLMPGCVMSGIGCEVSSILANQQKDWANGGAPRLEAFCVFVRAPKEEHDRLLNSPDRCFGKDVKRFEGCLRLIKGFPRGCRKWFCSFVCAYR